MHGGLLEIGVPHKFVYGEAAEPETMEKITAFARAAHLKSLLNMSTLGAFGGRGMGQTCGAADPSQWMRMFGVDIDYRDTTELVRTAENVTPQEIAALPSTSDPSVSISPSRRWSTKRSLTSIPSSHFRDSATTIPPPALLRA
jgi:L-arabinose isomerase